MKRPGYISLPRITVLAGVLFFAFWQILPSQLFDDPYSFVLESREGRLLGATIAADGQWRFPDLDTIPASFEQAILTFEDKRFYRHSGVDVLAMGRALVQNLRAREIKSGGSTLTMQVIRLSRKGQPRTIWEKVKEMFLAWRMEMSTSKSEILKLYASHAPFGGNVVGLEAAAWRYFGKSPKKLSQAEAACLAVLPNSPSLVRPGKNQSVLKEKRDGLLEKMASRRLISERNVGLFSLEPLPGDPHDLPQLAPHLMQRAKWEVDDEFRVKSSVHHEYQEQVNKILQHHYQRLSVNGVHNAAVLIMDVKSGEILSYGGNITGIENVHDPEVDVIDAPRSSGSILKPFLYNMMLQKGEILPGTLIPDVPTFFGNFHPQNYTEQYLGAVRSRDAISFSLNVPSVLMLRDHGIPVFHHEMQSLGMTTLNNPPGHYGLSLILGGAEVKLWDLVGMYGSMARTLKNFAKEQSYFADDIRPASYLLTNNSKDRRATNSARLDAGSVYQTFEAMATVRRPEEEAAWEHFNSSEKIAWKTGTSYGGRDAWAVGVTPKYVVGVWAGNADGEGRSGVSGLKSAAPILFDVFNFLPSSDWFQKPHEALYDVEVCVKSGFLKGNYCPETIEVQTSKQGRTGKTCPYHRQIFVSAGSGERVSRDCYEEEIKDTVWFILPGDMSYYYKKWHPNYQALPGLHAQCITEENEWISIIYPSPGARVQIPKELSGKTGKIVMEAALSGETELHWHLNERYVGTTKSPHQLAVAPPIGKHRLTVETSEGQRQSLQFEVISTH